MSSRLQNKTKAIKMLKHEVQKSRGDAWIDPKDRKVTIGELVTDLEAFYKGKGMETFAKDTASRWTNHLEPVFGNVSAHAFTTTMQRKYKAGRFADKDKPALATVNRELQILRRAYKLAARHEPPKVARVPVFELDREENARLNFFTAEQIDKLREAASKEGPDWRCFVELAYALGWRRGELLALRVENVDMLAGTVRIDTSKNGEPREAVLTDRLKLFVQPLVVNRAPDALMFASIDVSNIRYGWKRICKAAGVKGIVHDFRRTSARDKRAAGVDTSVIMEVSGWKSEALFRRYAITSREDKMDSQHKLEEYQSRSRTRVDQQEPSGKSAKEQVQ